MSVTDQEKQTLVNVAAVQYLITNKSDSLRSDKNLRIVCQSNLENAERMFHYNDDLLHKIKELSNTLNSYEPIKTNISGKPHRVWREDGTSYLSFQ